MKRFVILPTRGFIGTKNVSHETLNALVRLNRPGHRGLAFKRIKRRKGPARAAKPVHVRVIDSIRATAAKLVEMTDEAAFALRIASTGLRIVPEVRFQLAVAPRITVATTGKAAFPRATLTDKKVLVVTDDGKPLPDVMVVAFTNWAKGIGAEGKTNAKGEASLALPMSTTKLQRVLLYAEHTGWPVIRDNVALDGKPLKVPRIALDFIDSRAKAYAPFNAADGKTVKVGILDTGAGPHSALKIAKGVSAVTEDKDTGYNDTEGHGTHVAGVNVAPGGSLTAHG